MEEELPLEASSLSLTMSLDVTEDFAAELEDFIYLAHLGCIEAAEDIYQRLLKQHATISFPIAVEYIEVLLDSHRDDEVLALLASIKGGYQGHARLLLELVELLSECRRDSSCLWRQDAACWENIDYTFTDVVGDLLTDQDWVHDGQQTDSAIKLHILEVSLSFYILLRHVSQYKRLVSFFRVLPSISAEKIYDQYCLPLVQNQCFWEAYKLLMFIDSYAQEQVALQCLEDFTIKLSQHPPSWKRRMTELAVSAEHLSRMAQDATFNREQSRESIFKFMKLATTTGSLLELFFDEADKGRGNHERKMDAAIELWLKKGGGLDTMSKMQDVQDAFLYFTGLVVSMPQGLNGLALKIHNEPSTIFPDFHYEIPKIRRTGLTVLSGGDDSRVDIVFIHGLDGSPATTWSKGDFVWPFELQAYLKHSRVMLFGYDTDCTGLRLDKNRTFLNEVAMAFLSALANHRRGSKKIDRPLILVGHNLGGLVIKEALIRAFRALETHIDDWDRICGSTKAILFYGVPHTGAIGSEKKRVKLGPKQPDMNIHPALEKALRLYSPDTTDLAAGFKALPLCVRHVLKIYSFFETLPTAALGDLVVDEHSARLGYSDETLQPIQDTHKGMVRYVDTNDANFKRAAGILEYLQNFCIEATSNDLGTSSQPPSLPTRPEIQLPPRSADEILALNRELRFASGSADVNRVKELVEEGADVNFPQEEFLAGPFALAVDCWGLEQRNLETVWLPKNSKEFSREKCKRYAAIIGFLYQNGARYQDLNEARQGLANRALRSVDPM